MKCAAFLNDTLPMTILPVTSVSVQCGLNAASRLTVSLNETFDLSMFSVLRDFNEKCV